MVATSVQAETLMREFETVDDRRRDTVGGATLEVTGRRLWPHRMFTIDSPLPPADIVGRLEGATAAFRWWRGSSASRPFDGFVTPTAFALQSATLRWHGWRWARPRLHGRVVVSAGAGSRVSGTYTLHPAVAVVVSLWSIWVTAVAGLVLLSAGFDIVASISSRTVAISLHDVLLTVGAILGAAVLVGVAWVNVVRPFGDQAFSVVRALAAVVGPAR